MNAKDTKWCPQHGYPLPCDKCGMPLSPTQQKDIYEAGRKAGYEQRKLEELPYYSEERQLGIKEAIEFMKKELPEEYNEFAVWSVWQAKLKEWGIISK